MKVGLSSVRNVLLSGLIALGAGVHGGCGGESPQTGSAAAPANDQQAAEPVELQFAIEGMHCDGCATAITTAVGGIEGVEACEVFLEGETATITVVDANLAAEIIEKIAALGYTATPVEG